MSKHTILVDMDGPLADFDRHYWDTVNGLRRQHTSLAHASVWDIRYLQDQTHRFLSDHVNHEQIRSEARDIVNSSGWFEGLPPTEGAIAGIRSLADNADVWICTKPLETNPTCRDEKAAWIRRHLGPEWEKRLIIAPDKAMIDGELLLDDAIKPGWNARASWKPVVFSTPFNTPGTKFGQDWEQFSWAQGTDYLLGLVA